MGHPSLTTIKEIIYAEIVTMLASQGNGVPEVTDEDKLQANLGLTSLDLVQLVAVLTMKLQVDPFAHLVALTDLRTVGELCQAYSRAQSGQDCAGAEMAALRASQRQAQARRARRNR